MILFSHAQKIEPSDTAQIFASSLYVGETGDIAVKMHSEEQATFDYSATGNEAAEPPIPAKTKLDFLPVIVFKAVAAGTVLPIVVCAVMHTGTTAESIISLN